MNIVMAKFKHCKQWRLGGELFLPLSTGSILVW